MKSKVYFIRIEASDDMQAIVQKTARLLDESKLFDFIFPGAKTVIKMHFGEEGNTGYVRPEYVREVCDRVIARKSTCVLSDTNTLYRGGRLNSRDHLALAHEHGFTKDIVGVEVVIPDDTKKENCIGVEINQRFVKVAKIARLYLEADTIVGVAHFKGHIMTGFGGALKNLGMGCATRDGKLAQHSDVSPFVIKKKCTGCGACIIVCPAKAIEIKEEKSVIETAKCIGCASCIAACKFNAIELNWEAGGSTIQQKIAEYVKAVLKNKKGKTAFINFATKITQECDCLAKDDPRIAPDVGIFASLDPVSIDKACFDLVNQACGKDIFKEAHPKRDGAKQLKHASNIGLGSLEYELVEL